MGIAVAEYTLSDFARLLDLPVPNEQNAYNARNRYMGAAGERLMREQGPERYGGIQSFTQAKELFTLGWKKGADQLNELRSDLGEVVTAKSTKRIACFGADGEELRIERALAGDWDRAWRTSRRVQAPGRRTVELLVRYGGHWGQSGEELFWAGAAATVLTDVLESAGYSVALTASCPTTHNRNTWVARILLKESRDPMQIDAVASLLCNAGIFRTYGFRALSDAPFNVGEGLGSVRSWCDVEPEMRQVNQWPDDAVIVESAYTREGAIQEINRVLKLVQGAE